MPNPFGVPEISVTDVAQKRANGDNFILLDVREPHELMIANLGDDVTSTPLSQIAATREKALPDTIQNNKDVEIVVLCHHGNRSAQAAAFLRQAGWTNVFNMDGGIDAYAMQVDPDIARY